MARLLEELRRIRGSVLARNAGWMLASQGLSVVCQGVYFILLARLLGSAEYGIYVGVFATVAILSVYSPMGSQFTLIRHVSQDPKDFALYWGNVLITTCTLGSLFVGLLVWCMPRLTSSYTWPLVLCVALGDCLCGQLTDGCSRVFQAFDKMRITALLGLLVNLLRTILAGYLLLTLRHATARQWVLTTLAVSLLAAFAALALVTWHYGRPTFSVCLLRHNLGEGVVFALSSSTSSVYNNIDKAMLGHYGMNAANGIYAMAYRVVDIATMPVTSVHAAAFPRFFRKGVSGVSSTVTFALRILKRTAPLAIILTLAMSLVAPAIPHVVGKSFSESVLALRWLCLLPVFRSFQLSAGDALTGSGHLRTRLGIQGMAASFNFFINLFLIPHYGWIGAAWSSLATDGLLGVINWVVLLMIRFARPARRYA
jgi:O-antigen/teichoic acid export membrane protein